MDMDANPIYAGFGFLGKLLQLCSFLAMYDYFGKYITRLHLFFKWSLLIWLLNTHNYRISNLEV